MAKLATLAELADAVPDGARLAIPADYGGPSMLATFALVKRGDRGLRLVTAPSSGIQADILIGAGAVAEIETAGVSLGEYGMAERFRQAALSGRVLVRDATCPALHAAFQAAEKGVPFLPLRGLLGTDLLASRPDWHVIQNPLAEEPDPIVLIPAIHPDVALFHAPLADARGNVWVGVRRELMTLAHASRATLVTAEAIHDGDLLEDPVLAPGTLPHLYVDKVALAPGGTWPLGDARALAAYAQASRTEAGFKDWLHEHL
jgi:glutaconate CoA-transferase subunit A